MRIQASGLNSIWLSILLHIPSLWEIGLVGSSSILDTGLREPGRRKNKDESFNSALRKKIQGSHNGKK